VDTSILKERVSIFRVEGGVVRCDEVIYEVCQEGGPLNRGHAKESGNPNATAISVVCNMCSSQADNSSQNIR
jgi:hypothetical protein